MDQHTFQLAGYQARDLIYSGHRTLVYRCWAEAEQKTVVIKILRKDYPRFRELVRFRNQYAITKNLDVLGIVAPIALKRYGHSLALITEDDGSVSLNREMEQRGIHNYSLEEFFPIAIQLTEIIERLHRNLVIHKDIKPANIIINPETKQVKLIDFSLASLLPKETQEIKSPNVLEGTLGYISPEQTGRMNRGIDYRSDFYSLGVTFYELLTGQLPFKATEVMELVHCHLAKMPSEIGRWGDREMGREKIPQMVSDIVMKLMAKNAEERYQSALGLRYDLQKCWQQWQEKGQIEAFELGERDICDRFIIPEKLYGREKEVAQLLESFGRVAAGKSEMMLVAGYSGVGKTAVVNEIHKPIVRQRGYFIKGKFDQLNRNIPFSAFVQAFRDLMEQLLGESETQLQQWKHYILKALGDNAQVIIEVIPELQDIIGPQPPIPELSGSVAQNRFNLLFSQFVQVFTTKDHPLVIFLDDLQWADLASLNLLQLLLNETQISYLLILGAYRDNEVFPAHPLTLALNDIIQGGGLINAITLTPLSKDDLNQLVGDTLVCSYPQALPLTTLVHQKTQGNPFFATQFLQGLHRDELITFNSEAGYWQCDIAKVKQLAITDDVVQFMATQLQKLPQKTQNVLKLAACIGNQFDLSTLAIVQEQPQEEVAASLWLGLQNSLILPVSETYKFFQGNETQEKEQFKDIFVGYKFLHDRIQQAAYSLMSQEVQTSAHLTIGRLLLKNIPEHLLDSRIFDIINQLNCGLSLVQNRPEKMKIAQLNLQAGQRAKQSAAYQAALEYFVKGQNLLEESDWHHNYSFSLTLYTQLLEAYYLNGQFEQVDYWSKQILPKTNSTLDTIKVYEVIILTWVGKKQLDKAIQTGLSFLETLDIYIPTTPDASDVKQKVAEVSELLPQAGIESLANLPAMEDSTAIAAIRILNAISVPAYLSSARLFLLIVLTQVQLSINYGNCAISASAYARYGIALCGVLQQITLGYKSGELALKIIEKFEDSETKTRTLLMVGALVLPWQQHLREGRPLLKTAYQTGLESGNFEPAALACLYESQAAYLSGDTLSELEVTLKHNSEGILRLKQEVHLSYNNLLRQIVANLQRKSQNPWIISGEFCNENIFTSNCQSTNNIFGLFGVTFHKSVLCYLFGDFPQADKYIQQATTFLHGVTSQPVVPLLYWYDSLIQLALHGNESSKVLANLEKLKHWADLAPSNFHHKYHLIEAEHSRVSGQKLEAIDSYDLAIAGAEKNSYIQEQALANELAAKFYLNWGKVKIAQTYMQEAYYCYARWGAQTKVEHLEQTYPQLLQPLLLSSEKKSLNSQAITNSTTSDSTTILSEDLDLASLIKAYQNLSQEIKLEQLVSCLMDIVMENAGAQRCALLLKKNGQWWVEAQSSCHQGKNTVQLTPQLLSHIQKLPVKLINYTANRKKTFVTDNASREDSLVTDPYIIQEQPKSILCIPLLNQNQLIALLYLENHQTIAAFTTRGQELLELIASQAAISLKNAQLYQNLEQSLKNLQVTNQQLIKSEKMYSLGQLIAGIAHEINTPLGAIRSSGNNLISFYNSVIGKFPALLQTLSQDELELFFSLLKTCSSSQQVFGLEYRKLKRSLRKKLENASVKEADFYADYLADMGIAGGIGDFLPLLNKEQGQEILEMAYRLSGLQRGTENIIEAGDKAAKIVHSLKTFSHYEQSNQKKLANVIEGLEIALNLHQHPIKQGVEVVRNYGEVPPVCCYADELNQVWTNLINNALQAMDNRGKLTINVISKAEINQVKVDITDTGSGIPPELQKQIFEPFFTTKQAGEGSGLGLGIVKKIILKHQGNLKLESRPGETTFTVLLPIE